MKRMTLLFGFIAFFLLLNFVKAGIDTCAVNDICASALDFPYIEADDPYICFTGCNEYAAPDSDVYGCYMGDFPTVWYRLTTDPAAIVMNIELYSAVIATPAMALFVGTNGCNQLEQVSLAQGSDCVIGADGHAKVIGIPIDGNEVYYLAVSSVLDVGGEFDLCINTLSAGFVCVVDRNIEITARSNGGPLEGPYEPNETISVCLHVNHYTAANNGCQWFQGIVPVFGNGWDPGSFDSNGQPLTATVNGNAIGISGNGVYGTARWDWQDSVGYHHDHPTYNIADFDGNGRIEICNSAHEADCPAAGGILGGCCGPCWPDAGTLLPPGWFAHGINGTCADTNYIAEEWGDGNTCGSGMGPWSFCFDLITRDVDDCMTDSTYSDLTLGFYTMADGEIGAWTGLASTCALDVPAKISMIGLCGRISTGGNQNLPEHCHGDTLRFQLDEDNITDWEWNISPFSAVPFSTNSGKNGFIIEAPLVNESEVPIDVSGTLVGRTAGSGDVLLRKFSFVLQPAPLCGITSDNTPSQQGLPGDYLKLIPVLTHDRVTIEIKQSMQPYDRLILFDVNSQPVMEFDYRSFPDQQKVVQIGHLSDGMYFVTLFTADGSTTKRMVKL